MTFLVKMRMGISKSTDTPTVREQALVVADQDSSPSSDLD